MAVPAYQSAAQRVRIGLKETTAPLVPKSDYNARSLERLGKLSDRIHFPELVIAQCKAHPNKAMRSLLFTCSISFLLAAGACSKSKSGPETESPTQAPIPAAETATEGVTTPVASATDTGEVPGAFPNLQALPKSWGESELTSYMKEMSGGLGVQCDHCHNVENMGVETEMKGKARSMIEMTRALDKEYFAGQGRLACMTCHQGKTVPSDE